MTFETDSQANAGAETRDMTIRDTTLWTRAPVRCRRGPRTGAARIPLGMAHLY